MTTSNKLSAVRTFRGPSLKRRVLLGMQRGMQWSGASRAYLGLVRPRGGVILMYHSVPRGDAARWIDPRNTIEPDVFREQMRYLAAHRRVVSMSRLAAELEAGESPPPGTTAITFDDGYRDNLEVAAPILAEFNLPATLYVPTGYIARGDNQWLDRLYAAFRARSNDHLDLTTPEVTGSWRLQDPQDALRSYQSISAAMIEAGCPVRERLLELVEAQLAPSAKPPRLMLDWNEIRTLLSRFPSFDLGGHTVDHLDLRARGVEACRDEMRGCADDIERETRRTPEHFSFPYGRSSAHSRKLVPECGFRTAVASGDDVLLGADADRTGLPRIEPSASPALFRFWTSGAYPGLSRLLLGRS